MTATDLLMKTILLYQQTGHFYATQSFRHFNYVVAPHKDDEIPQLKQPKSNANLQYSDVYERRRQMLQLNHDSTEMLAFRSTHSPVISGSEDVSTNKEFSVSQVINKYIKRIRIVNLLT